MVASRQLASMILWGPPGCGKTTIARLLAHGTDLVFEPLSAVFSGVADLRKVFEAARKRREMGHGTLLFVDEIHRFNRAQQDAFLPVCRGRHRDPRRRDDREPVLRADRRIAVARPGLRAAPPRRRRPRNPAAPRRAAPRARPAADRRRPRRAARDGRRRRPLPVQPGRGDRPPAGRRARSGRSELARDRAAPRAALRQGAGRPLQPDQRAAQIAARLGYRCGALLAGAHAGRRRGPDLHPAPADPGGGRGYRPRRPAGASSRRSRRGTPTTGSARPRASWRSPNA